MKLFTSSWFAALPRTFVRVGVSRSVRRNIGAGYRRIRLLEPGPWLDAAPDEFCRLYAQQLDRLDARAIVARIEAMAAEAGASAASLACYESPSSGAWCHRAMVSHWLHDRLGLEVHELGHEQCGCGASAAVSRGLRPGRGLITATSEITH